MSPHIGQYCIIRSRDAGVHAGTVASVNGASVHLVGARRIWKWAGAFTLSEVSQDGIDQSKSRIARLVPSMEIIGACEIIPCSAAAKSQLESADNG